MARANEAASLKMTVPPSILQALAEMVLVVPSANWTRHVFGLAGGVKGSEGAESALMCATFHPEGDAPLRRST